ncbi:endonuclease/exonuclease/phosphatase family protein [Phycicoccus sp. Root101]|uniref:endonuclease/exonuclease/phosphatase family protein n=1 Tax=Phycicoccus sp. Root101 TaxID=1736421 RepID=UPI0007028EAD|nr:endonuclease/exonuclease/phosphatase family protein [Phycicoccus sp. Root101]KQU69150.1 endonuclease/exonuclease/phosphatase [Phycicoccus sp. Root101]
MRIASFNVENLFDRARLLGGDDWSTHRTLLEKYARLTRLLQRPTYTADDKALIALLLVDLGLEKSDSGTYVTLRQNRGRLLSRPRAGGLTVVAEGRRDWVGWLELRTQAVTELATHHTALVVHDLAADVLGVVEAESRIALQRFNVDLLRPVSDRIYGHVMLVDGNDDRGIDVGIMTRGDHPIEGIVSHVDDADLAGPIFGRDCPEYSVSLPGGGRLLVLVNHFKSKGYGKASESDTRRRRQAERVAEIYRQRRAEGHEHVVVLGDLNDFPGSAPLAPLLVGTSSAPSDLRDVSAHPSFDDGGYPGTYTTGRTANKIDYILCSPAVFTSITAGGIFRKGVWTASRRWEMYPTLTREQDAASDHAALWVDVDL